MEWEVALMNSGDLHTLQKRRSTRSEGRYFLFSATSCKCFGANVTNLKYGLFSFYSYLYSSGVPALAIDFLKFIVNTFYVLRRPGYCHWKYK